MKTLVKFLFAIYAVLLAAIFNSITSLDKGLSGPRFIVSQNPFSGRSRGSMMNFVATTWKGLNVLKGKPLTVANPNTAAQQLQRAKFSFAVDIGRAVLSFIQLGLKGLAIHQTEFNVFVSNCVKNAITGTLGNLTITGANLMFSSGTLLNPATPTLSDGGGQQLDLTWVDNSGDGNALVTDELYVVVSQSLDSDIATKVKTFVTGNTRDEAGASVNLDASFSGQNAYAWAFFISADGQLISDSMYLGSQAIA